MEPSLNLPVSVVNGIILLVLEVLHRRSPVLQNGLDWLIPKLDLTTFVKQRISELKEELNEYEEILKKLESL